MQYVLNGAEAPLAAFDAVEIHAMSLEDEPAESESAAVYWSVALHYITGGIECVADLPSRESATALAIALEQALRAVAGE